MRKKEWNRKKRWIFRGLQNQPVTRKPYHKRHSNKIQNIWNTAKCSTRGVWKKKCKNLGVTRALNNFFAKPIPVTEKYLIIRDGCHVFILIPFYKDIIPPKIIDEWIACLSHACFRYSIKSQKKPLILCQLLIATQIQVFSERTYFIN